MASRRKTSSFSLCNITKNAVQNQYISYKKPKRKNIKKISKNPLTNRTKSSIIDERSAEREQLKAGANRSLKIEQHEISSTELRELRLSKLCRDLVNNTLN